MSIEWTSLLLVAVVAIGVTGLFAVFLSFGIRLLAQARVATDEGRPAAAARTGAWIMVGLMALILLFGLYLIIPQFH